ncbi:MAG: IS66 family transposase [Planctomycetales bacterium]|nr:IS66 family transposase [Planctomycetales bacterium]
MKPDDSPTDIESLRKLLVEAQDRAESALHARRIALEEKELAEQRAAELSTTIASQRQQLDKQEQTIKELLASLRGKRRERVDPNQLLMFDLGELEAVIEEAAEEELPARRKRRRGHGRRLIPDHLPEVEVVHELPESQRLCPHDGQPMQMIRYEISKQLEYEPSKMKVIVHKRAVYGCSTKHDEAKLLTAPKPPQPIEKGLAGPGLLAAVTVGKFGDHLPGYRLEDIFSRHRVPIRRSTIFDWLAGAADLAELLVNRMAERMRASKVVHTDDTQVKLIDYAIRGTRTARFWAYVGDRDHPYTVYDFTETRERAGPQRFLKSFRGYLQADAYGGYDGIYLESGGDIIEVACWTHCRRYWWKAREQDPPRAHYALAVINKLYEVEREAKSLDTAARQQLRAERSAPLVERLEEWLRSQDPLPKSLIAKAVTYTTNQWRALTRFLEDGDLSIDNNLSERTVKPVAIGRKNWLFVGSAKAGQRAARLMSLVASCKANRVEPWAYLRDVFTQLPLGADIDSLLPDRWLAAHPEHRWVIADQREQERQAKGNL